VLPVDFLRAPPVGQMIHGDFNHLDSRIVDPRQTVFVQVNVVNVFRDGHGAEANTGSSRAPGKIAEIAAEK